MSGYEYVDSDRDLIYFDRPHGTTMHVTAKSSDEGDSVSVYVTPFDFPEFLQGVAEQMGLKAVVYNPATVASVTDFPERQVGNMAFRFDRTGRSVSIRRGPQGVVCGMLEGWQEVQHAGATLMAMGDELKARAEKKEAERAREEELAGALAALIKRGDTSRINHGAAMRAAREVIKAGWTPPSTDYEEK